MHREAEDYIISLQSDSHNVIDSKTYNVAADIVYDESNPRSTDETAAVNHSEYYRYYQMFCGRSEAGLQRNHFLEQLGQIFF